MKNAPIITLSLGVILVMALIFIDNPPAPINIFAASESGSVITPRTKAGETIQSILSGETDVAPIEENNLTREVAVTIAESLLADQNFLTGGEISAEALTEKIITSGLKLSDKDFNPTVNDASLKIVSDPTIADYEKYDDLFSKIVEKYFSLPRTDLDSRGAAEFEKLRNATRELIVSSYAIPVPDNIASIHKAFIRALLIQEEAFGNLINFETDPLKAIASAEIVKKSHEEIVGLLQTFANINL